MRTAHVGMLTLSSVVALSSNQPMWLCQKLSWGVWGSRGVSQ